ncbi:MAG: NAD(P)-dependent oxidoreductase [Microbacteriaceae bacterium]|nr:NAD(P)-dependent oxidoreductase [Microbacteriaceae bacterium]
MIERALVTGATGFLGGHLARRLLASGAHVTVLHRAGDSPALDALAAAGATIATFNAHDEIAELVAQSAPDATFHLATRYVRNHRSAEIDDMLEATIAYGTHLLEALVGSGSVVLSAMTFFQFRDGRAEPNTLYSGLKQAFLEISRFYRASHQLDIREVILFDTFGPGDERDKLIPRLFAAAAQADEITLGPSAQLLNLLYVDDVVDGFIAAVAPGNPATMTINSAETVSVGELVSLIEAVSDRTISATFASKSTPDNRLLHAGTWPWPAGWKPSVPVRSGLELSWSAARQQTAP